MYSRRRFPLLVIAFAVSTTFQSIAWTDEAVKPKLILDADTANEIDDLFAIARVLRQDKFEVLGISSAQWFHYLGDPNAVQASQKLNEDLVRLLGPDDLPTPLGAERPMGKPWGGTDAKDSAAAQFIIQQARSLPAGEKLHVACIGASTNLASAIKLAPEIAPKIVAHLMGFRYANGAWNKSEFNIRRDLNAADFLLNNADVELHVMTATASEPYKFDRDETYQRNESLGELGQYLTDRWKDNCPDDKKRVMWDLALIHAMIHPHLATEVQVDTPPENTQRKAWVYTWVDVEGMEQDYWEAVGYEDKS